MEILQVIGWIFAALVLAGTAGLVVVDYISIRKTGKGIATEEEIEKAKEIALKILEKVGLALFTNAEITYGGGTGVLKMSAVIGQLISMLPDDVKELVPTDWLIEKAETLLTDAKQKWATNERLLNINKD